MVGWTEKVAVRESVLFQSILKKEKEKNFLAVSTFLRHLHVYIVLLE